MDFLQKTEQELRRILDSDEPDADKLADEIVKFVRIKILESYKNGLRTARKGRRTANSRTKKN